MNGHISKKQKMIERQTDRHIKTHRQTGRHPHAHTHTHTYRPTDTYGQIGRYEDRQTHT